MTISWAAILDAFLTTVLVCWLAVTVFNLVKTELEYRRFKRWLADPNSEYAQFQKAIEELRSKRCSP